MAKKVVINENELEPTVLYKIKSRRFGFLRLVFLFIIFIGTVLFLPEISNYVEAYKSGEAELSIDEIVSIFKTDKYSDKDDDIVVDNKSENNNTNKYEFNDTTTISNDNITINNFKFENHILSFDVTNLKDESNDLKSQKYFLTAFDASDSVIKRIKVAEELFNAKETKSYSYNVESDAISYFMFDELTIDKYPTSENVKDGNMSLVCTKPGEMVIYYYNDNILSSIKNTIAVNKDSDNYDTKLAAYQAKVVSYNGISGVEVQLDTADTMFTYSITIDNNIVDISKLDNVIYYTRATRANVIIYEMESRDYTCK